MDNSLQRGWPEKGRGVMYEDLLHPQNTLPTYSGVMAAGEHTEGVFLQGLKTNLFREGGEVTVDRWGNPSSPPRIPGKWLTRQNMSSPISPLELTSSPITHLLKKPRGVAPAISTLEEEELGVSSNLEMALNIY